MKNQHSNAAQMLIRWWVNIRTLIQSYVTTMTIINHNSHSKFTFLYCYYDLQKENTLFNKGQWVSVHVAILCTVYHCITCVTRNVTVSHLAVLVKIMSQLQVIILAFYLKTTQHFYTICIFSISLFFLLYLGSSKTYAEWVVYYFYLPEYCTTTRHHVTLRDLISNTATTDYEKRKKKQQQKENV